MRSYLGWLCLLGIFCRIECFLPNGVFLSSAGTRHHGNITLEALERTVSWFLDENADLYPPQVQEKIRNSKTFKDVMNSFRSFVGKPDNHPPRNTNSAYHFTAEKFVESNMNMILDREKVINAIKNGTSPAIASARMFASWLFHTLQDFYSSSNWIELGKEVIKEDLGTGEAFQDIEVASPDERTCEDCQALGECRYNIRANIMQDLKLTSGYYSKHSSEKPTGKCGHGGNDDNFRELVAKGGINKETTNPLRSPHHYHHQLAASLAVDATVDILRGIYQATINDKEKFGEFLGLEVMSTLCFVIDTTGSMAQEIEDVKSLTIRMTKDAEASGQNFVLVPVNDPHPGIIHMTNDSTEMIQLLAGLRAHGGGDEPEMSMSGMLLAAQNVRSGSKCYVFTDADAKDKELTETLKSVLTSRHVQMEFKLTTIARKKRSADIRRSKRSIQDVYKEIAEVSGGTVVMVRKGELKEALKTVEVEAKIFTVSVSFGFLTSNPNFTFNVDSTMNQTYLEVSVIGSTLGAVFPSSPSGGPADYLNVTNVQNSRLLKLINPEKGNWTVEVKVPRADDLYSYRVFCETPIDFTYTLLTRTGSSIDTSPIKGEEYYIEIQTYGPIDKDSLSLNFVSTNGTVLNQVKVRHSSSDLVAKAVLPDDDAGFYVSLHGRDDDKRFFQRMNPNIVKTSRISLELALHGNETLDLKPNQTLVVRVRLMNTGVKFDRWTVNIYDSGSYLVGNPIRTLTVGANKTEEFLLQFSPPKHSKPGDSTTVSVTASAAEDRNIRNSLVFYVSVIPEKSDLTSPTCEIESFDDNVCRGSGSAPCESVRWNVSVKVQDMESGLTIFKAGVSYPHASFSNDVFQKGTNDEVKGRYESSCCFPNITIVAVDGNGNVGRCSLRMVSAAQPSLTTSFFSDLISLIVSMILAKLA